MGSSNTPTLAQSYKLKVVAKVGDVIDGRTLTSVPFSFASLNDNGTIAILASFTNPDGSPGTGIFTLDRLLVEVGQELHGKTLTFLGGGILDNNDEITFLASFNGGRGAFTLGELLAETGDLIDGQEVLGFISSPLQNDLGEMLLHAVTAPGAPSHSILVTRDGIVAETGAPIEGRAPFNIVSGVDLNNAGDIVFVDVELFPSQVRALMTPNAVLLESPTIVDGKEITGFRDPSLNNNRKVVFDGGPGIFSYDIATGEGELLFEWRTPVQGETIQIGGGPQLNDREELAFYGVFAGTPRREAVIANGELVMQTGDVIEGESVSSFGPFIALNNKGDLAFIARYPDFRTVVVYATQVSDGDGIPDDEDDCDDSRRVLFRAVCLNG